jgi:hypothetical protein
MSVCERESVREERAAVVLALACGCRRVLRSEERGARGEAERREERQSALRLPTSLETCPRAMQTTHTHAHIHTCTHTNGLGSCVNGDKRLGSRVLAVAHALTYSYGVWGA